MGGMAIWEERVDGEEGNMIKYAETVTESFGET